MYLFSRILPPIITNNNNNHNQPHNPNHPDTTGIDSSFCSTGGPLSPTTSTTSSTVHRNLARTRSRGDYDYSPANSPGPDPRNINRYRSPVSERYRTPPVTIREEDDEDSYIDYDDEELYYVTTPTELKRPRLPLVEAEEKELAKKKTGTGLDRGLLNSAIAAAKGIIREDSSDPYAWAFNGGNKTPLSAEVRSIGSRSSSSAGSSPRHRRLSQQQPYVEDIPDGVYTPPLIHEAREYTPPLSHSTTASQELPDDYRRALQRQLQRQRDFDDAVANPIGVEEFDHHFDPSASSPVISRRNTAAAVYTMSAPPVRYVDASQLSREDLDSKQNHFNRHNQRSGSVCSTTMSSSSSSANQPRPGQISRSSTWSYGMVSPSGPTTPYSPPPPTYENSEFINRLRADQEREDNLMKAAILASQQKDAYDQILDPHKRELEDAELLVALEESRRIQREEEEFYTVLAASRQDDEERIRREAAQREEEERLRFQREREQRERMERLQREKENRERAERLERERLERERHDREILERKRMELDRLEEERERLERERMEQGRPRWGGGSVDFSSAPKPDQGGYAVQYSPAGRLSQHPSSIGNKAAAEQPTTTVSDAYYNSIINSTGRRNSGEGSPIEGSPYESPAQRRFREMLRETAAEAAAERGE